MRCEPGPCESGMSPDCTGRAVHAHHRKLRSQGGGDEDANRLNCCPNCHLAIHAKVEMAYNMGQLVHSWQDLRRGLYRDHEPLMPIQPRVSQTTTNFTGNGTVNPLKLFIPNMDKFDPATQAAMLQIQQYINNLNAPITPVPPVIVADVAWVSEKSGNEIQGINTRSGMVVASITTAPGGAVISEPVASALTIDGHYLYAVELSSPGTNNLVDVIDTTSGTCIEQIIMTGPQGYTGLGLALVASPDGTLMYSVGRGNPTTTAGITAIVIASNTLGLVWHLSSAISGVLISPDGTKLYTYGTATGRFYTITASTMTTASSFVGGAPAQALSLDGTTAYGGAGSNINVLNIAATTSTLVPTAGGTVVGSRSRLGRWVYGLCATSNTLDVLDTTTNTIVASVSLGFHGLSCYPNSDDSLVWITGSPSYIQAVVVGSWALGPTIPIAGGGNGIALTF